MAIMKTNGGTATVVTPKSEQVQPTSPPSQPTPPPQVQQQARRAPVPPATQSAQPTPAPVAPPIAQQANQQTTQQQPKNPSSITMNMNHTIHSRRRMGYASSNASGIAAEMLKLFDETSKTPVNDGNKYDVLSINAGTSGLKISVLVFVARPTDVKIKRLAHHTLLLGATAPIEPIKAQHSVDFARTAKVTRMLMACDGYDNMMKSVIKNELARTYPGYEQLSAEASEVPRTIASTDVITLNNLISNATRAAGTVLYYEGNSDAVDFTLTDLINPETKEKAVLSVETNCSFAHQSNMVNQPTRADVILTVSEARPRNNRDDRQAASFNGDEANNRISRISGFFDLTWTGTNSFAPTNFGMGNTSTIQYSPQFIVTDIDTLVTETLPTLFLALASLQSLADGQRWKKYLLKQHIEGAAHMVGGNKNLRDLGQLGWEIQGGAQGQDIWTMMTSGASMPKAPFPTGGNNHNIPLLEALINTYIGNSVLPVSFDIPEAGTSTWVTSVLLHAAIGGQGNQADQTIRDALDLLTNGEFTIAYAKHPDSNQGSKPMMINNNMLVNLGHWHDSAYGDRDIRDLDYLGNLAMTAEGDPAAQANWQALHVNTGVDAWLRLESMTAIQRSIFQNMEITGRAARVTIQPLVLYVLAGVISSMGFPFELKESNGEADGVQRMTAAWLPQTNSNLNSSGAFTAYRNGGNNTGGFAGGITNSGRYSNGNNQNNGSSY